MEIEVASSRMANDSARPSYRMNALMWNGKLEGQNC